MAPLRVAAQTSCYQGAQTQAELTRCAREANASTQSRLVELLGELRAALEAEQFNALERVQGAWLVYARNHCRWSGRFFEGGSMQSMVVADCMASLTEQRITELKTYRCGKPLPPGECP